PTMTRVYITRAPEARKPQRWVPRGGGRAKSRIGDGWRAMRRRASEGAVRAATRKTKRKTWGGVSPIPHAPSIRGVRLSRKQAPAPPTAARFPGFVYNGGPVIASPQVYTSFWGPLWTQDQAHKSRADRLSRAHADLLQRGLMNVLSQSGVGHGAGAAAPFV